MDRSSGFVARRDSFLYAAIFYLALTVIVLIRNSILYHSYSFIWFCDLSLLLFAIAFFTGNVQFVKGLINIGLIAQFIYILAIVLYIFLGISLSSLPADLLQTNIFNIIISISIHLFSTNLALALTYKRRTMKSSLSYSIIIIMLLFILTIAFTPKGDNVNYVFSSEFLFGLAISYYGYLWPILAFLILILPTYWFQKLLFRIHRRKA